MPTLLETIDPALLAKDQEDARYSLSPFANLKTLGPRVRGSRFEQITIWLMQQLGHQYQPRTSSDHDALFDGVSYEIKGSMLARNQENFSFLQIRPSQDYDSMLFAMFYPTRVILMTMTKNQVLTNVTSGVFRPQHGGNQAHSGTYCYYGQERSLASIGAVLLHEIE